MDKNEIDGDCKLMVDNTVSRKPVSFANRNDSTVVCCITTFVLFPPALTITFIDRITMIPMI